MERKSPSSSKSPKKQDSSKQNAEETSRITKSKTTKVYKRIYSEDSSSDEMANANWSQIESDNSYFHSASRDDRFNERVLDNSSDDSLDISMARTSRVDSDSIVGELRLEKKTSSPLSVDFFKPVDTDMGETSHSDSDSTAGDPDLPASGSSSPFRFWGKNASKPTEPLRGSEIDEAREDDGTEKVDGANAQNTSKDINKEIRKKEWEIWKTKAALKKQLEKLKELKRSKRSKKEDAENAGENPCDEDSNENQADAKFSPVTAVHKEVSKRLSDSGNALKENTPRTSM